MIKCQNLTEIETAQKLQTAPVRVNPGARSFARQRYAWCALPYGRWITASGRTIIFNRRYQPIWELAKPADPAEFIEDIVNTKHFYNDGNSPTHDSATYKRLVEMLRGLRHLPQ